MFSGQSTPGQESSSGLDLEAVYPLFGPILRRSTTGQSGVSPDQTHLSPQFENERVDSSYRQFQALTHESHPVDHQRAIQIQPNEWK